MSLLVELTAPGPPGGDCERISHGAKQLESVSSTLEMRQDGDGARGNLPRHHHLLPLRDPTVMGSVETRRYTQAKQVLLSEGAS